VLTFFACFSSAQGLLWQRALDADEISIARAANGDIFVAGVTYSPNVVPMVTCYSANGTLKSQTVLGGFSVSQAEVHDAVLSGSNLYFVVNMGGQFSRLYKFDTVTNSSSSTLLASGASQLSVSGLTVGSTDYCVAGRRVSDNAGVIQVRSLSDNSILREVVTTYNFSRVFATSTYYFVIGCYSSASINRFVVYRVSAVSMTSRSLQVPTTSPFFLTTPVEGHLASEGTLVIMSNFQGQTWGDLYVVPFSTDFLTFGNLWSDTYENLIGQASLGANRFVIALANRFVAFESSGAVAFETSYPDFTSGLAFTGAANKDASGNAVFALATSGESWVYRLSPTGSLLNKAPLGVIPATIGASTIDSAGMLRFAVERTYTASDWYLCGVSQGSLSLPSSVTVGGTAINGTIGIGGPSPAGGATFELFSSRSAAVVPTTVTIPEGQTSATFQITTSPVATNTKPTINARYNGIVLQSNFDLAAPLIQSVTATPQSQYGGVNITGTVNLTGPAPSGGKTVNLTSSNTSRVNVPSSVLVPAGSSSANFAMTTSPTLANASSVVTATTGAVSRTVFVAVVAPVFQNATLATNSIKGGLSTTMTLTIGTPAPSGYTITLASGASSFVQFPTSFAIPAGQTTVNLPVTTSPVTSNTPVTLFAYRGPYIKTMTLTVTP